jgi:hypothetical protein
MTTKTYLWRLFDYISTTNNPNIDVYAVVNNIKVRHDYNTLVFKPEYVLKYLWFYKSRNQYYCLLQLTNTKYMYLTGIIGNNTKFKIYIGSDKEHVVKCMKSYVYEWYLEDTV